MFSARTSFITIFPRRSHARRYCYNKRHDKKRWDKSVRTPHKRREKYIPLPLIQGDLLFGIHPVSAALQRQHRDIYGAFFKVDTDNPRVRAVWELCEDKRIPILQVTGQVMDQMVQNRPHQGVCLDVSPLPVKVLTESDISPETLFTKDGKPALWLLPFQIKDPMNMGAVLRSAHFFGVQNILLPHQNNADLSPVVSKASSGALEMLSIKQFSNGTHLYDTMQKWKDTGGVVVGSSSKPNTDKGMAANKFKMQKPTLLIIGNESYGLPGHITNRCDILLHIEGMCESTHNIGDFSVDSLNVSAATAVLLYSVLNSR